VSFALPLEPIENTRIEAHAHSYLESARIAQTHHRRQLFSGKTGISVSFDGESEPEASRRANSRTARRSLSLHFLFAISSDFVLFSPAGTDDSNSLFAMIVLPANVNDQQHRRYVRSDANLPNRVRELLSRLAIDTVGSDETALVFENERGQFERDSIVVLLVPMNFRLVQFVSHRVYTDCIAFPCQRKTRYKSIQLY
jgi:hypothetical protein